MKNLLRYSLFLTISLNSFGQITSDTLDLRSDKLDWKHFRDHESSYLVTLETAAGDLMNTSVWSRKIRIEDQQVVVTQKWKNVNKKAGKEVYSVLEANSFRPIYHKVVKGDGSVSAFNFLADRIVGADSVANNGMKDFKLDVGVMPYNWELDIEFLQLIPYRENADIVVKFYHPGGSMEPSYYHYRVTGKEEIEMPDGHMTLAWVVQIEYAQNSAATFWVGVENRQMLKMQEVSGPYLSRKIKI